MSTNDAGRYIAPTPKARKAVVIACVVTASILGIWIELDEFLAFQDLNRHVNTMGGRVEWSQYGYNPFNLQFRVFGPQRNLSLEEREALDVLAVRLSSPRIYKNHEVFMLLYKDGLGETDLK